jgi:drug/metabolite transporter (DMT)-like permease
MSLESFPPLKLIAFRFLLSGGIMLIVALFMRVHLPTGRELAMTVLFGILTLGGGNGTLVFAEQWIPSGTAALFITTGPFWMVGLEALLPGGDRLYLPVLAGIVVGFLGVLLMVAPAAFGEPMGGNLVQGFMLLQFGCLCWSLGALLQRRHPTKAHPVVSGAVQQLAVGLVYLPFATFSSESPVVWKSRSVAAALYLVVFGSIVGYSAFVYVMEHLPVPIVSTYNYVNPVVAMFLGWLFYREPFGWRELFAMIAVFSGVALVKYYSGRAPGGAQPGEPECA